VVEELCDKSLKAITIKYYCIRTEGKQGKLNINNYLDARGIGDEIIKLPLYRSRVK
jgi:hypothetical protein